MSCNSMGGISPLPLLLISPQSFRTKARNKCNICVIMYLIICTNHRCPKIFENKNSAFSVEIWSTDSLWRCKSLHPWENDKNKHVDTSDLMKYIYKCNLIYEQDDQENSKHHTPYIYYIYIYAGPNTAITILVDALTTWHVTRLAAKLTNICNSH